jgi:hypothetical protein
MFFCEPREVGEPDLDEGRDLRLDPRLAGELERPFPARPRLLRVGSLLEAVVALDEGLLDTNSGVSVHFPHPT